MKVDGLQAFESRGDNGHLLAAPSESYGQVPNLPLETSRIHRRPSSRAGVDSLHWLVGDASCRGSIWSEEEAKRLAKPIPEVDPGTHTRV